MGKRESANDPTPEPDPSDDEWPKWVSKRDRRDLFEICPPGYHIVNPERCQPFCGRWLLQYFDLLLRRRYSIGSSPDGRFFVLCLYDSDRHTTLDWFSDQKAIFLSLDIPKNQWSPIHESANKTLKKKRR